MTVCGKLQGRFLLVADRFPMRTTGVKTAARGRVDRAGNITLKNSPFFFAARVGDRNRR